MPDARAALEQALSGTYAFERELGRGGMATVHLARDLKHDRLVALKVLLPELAQNLGAERFQREIHIAARLQHPHILTVLDSGAAAGQLWFTMPYVEGESLRDRLKRERQLPVDEALRIAAESARALDYAHEHGVVHRDIKPENILLTKDGSTLVADFGIARAIGGDENLTQTGFAIGTPAYMSPEQASGDKTVDARSDTYSLAAVLYEMLAGEPPFTGPTAQAMIAKRFTEPVPSVRRMRPMVSMAADLAIQQGLAPLAADRFATTGGFVHALTGAMTGPEVPNAVDTGAGRRRVPATALALLLGLVIGGGLLYAAWLRPDRETGKGAGATVPIRVAVLRFENRGDSANAYFADGMAEAVRAKLTDLPGLAVIARASSESYAGSSKPLATIARELDVDFLLSGTVRWARAGDGSSRVQVNPELIAIVNGKPESRWQQPFDAALTDVFQVQGDIAGKVANALNVELGPQDVQALARRPTDNLAAYDAFLRAEAITGVDIESVRRRAALYGKAATLDSSFGVAWANWAGSLAFFASYGAGTSADKAQAVKVLERAVALEPTSMTTYRARLAVAEISDDDGEYAAVRAEALTQHPTHPATAILRGWDAVENGMVDSAVGMLARSVALDPRSVSTRREYASILSAAGRQQEARDELTLALALAPGDLWTLLLLGRTYLAEGSLDGARRFLAPHLDGPDGALLGAFIAYIEMPWLLTRAQQDVLLILEEPVAAFGGDSAGQAVVFAQIYHARGDSAQARRWGEVARRRYDAGGTATGFARVFAGLSLAYQGRFAEAIQDGKEGMRFAGVRQVLSQRRYFVEIYMLSGEHAKAIGEIEELHRTGPWYLRLFLPFDPVLAPLRTDARVKAILDSYTKAWH